MITVKVGRLYREKMISQIKDGVEKNRLVLLLKYKETASSEMDSLRKSLKKVGADVYVTKNALALKALTEIKQNKLAEKLDGQSAFVFSSADSVAITKAFVDFAKKNTKVMVQGGLLDGAFIDASDVKRLSDLPSREVLLSQLLGTIQSPVSRLAYIFNAKSRDLLSILKQLSERKGGA